MEPGTGCLPRPAGDGDGPSDADAASSSSASSCGSTSRASRPRSRGVLLRPRRRERTRAARDGRGDGGVLDDLALPLGMSFAAVLAQVVNTKNRSGETLQPALLSKICTSAVKESLRNTQGDKFDSFMTKFEKSFSSTLTTLHLVNEMPVCEKGTIPQCCSQHEDSVATSRLSTESPHSPAPVIEKSFSSTSATLRLEMPVCEQGTVPKCSSQHENNVATSKLSTEGPKSPAQEIAQDLLSSVEGQLVLYAGGNRQLTRHTRSRSSPGADQRILSAFERSLKEQARSNELKEFEIGLSMRKLQLKQSQLELSSYSHMLEKIKLSFGFQKASFQGEKLKTQIQETRHAQILRTLIDFLVSAVIIMSVCFGYGTYIYSYQRITDITAACSVTSKGSKSWWMPSSVSNFNAGLLFLKCHFIAATRMGFGIVMILAIALLAFQRSAVTASSMTASSMPVTFYFILLGGICGFSGRFCVNTLGGDGNIWFILWEALCLIHLLGNCYPSVLCRILHGPISVSQSKKVVWFPYWTRRCIFYAALGFIIPVLTGLLPFASLSDWNNHFAQELNGIFLGEETES